MLLPIKLNEFVASARSNMSKNVLVLNGFSKWLEFLCVVGYIFHTLKHKITLTLTDVKISLMESPDEVQRSLHDLGLKPLKKGRRIEWRKWRSMLQLLRSLQAFRIVDIDLRGSVLRSDKVLIEVLFPEKLPRMNGMTYLEYGAAAIWSLYLCDNIAQRIVLASFNTRPGSEEVIVDTRGLELNVYDRILLEEFRYTVQRWISKDNPFGVRRGGFADTLFMIRPLNDVSMLLALACIAGIGRPTSSTLAETLMCEVSFDAIVNKRGSKYYKDFASRLGSWRGFREVLSYVKEGKNINLTNVPRWQREAIHTVSRVSA